MTYRPLCRWPLLPLYTLWRWLRGYVAHCGGCGCDYTADTWRDLPLVGVQDCGDGTGVELRNCQCLARAGVVGAYTLGVEIEVRL
jgi:hypothetical protein